MGYETQLTAKTADYGADIVAKKGEDTFVIQVKRYSYANKVGNRDIQRLLGSMWKYKANKAIFVTSSDFTDFAYEQAVGAPIEL
jgi:restriction system protein